jgi:hypothetical protein
MTINSSQKFVFRFCSYLGFVVLFFKNEYLDFWELHKIATVH